MAKYSARLPMIATRTVSGDTVTYTGGVIIGKLIQTVVTPTVTPAEIYGDDGVAEKISEFIEAAVSINTTNIPTEAYEKMFGVTHAAAVTTSGSETPETITYGKDAEAPYVGYGFVTGEIVNRAKKFKVTWLPKVQFVLPGETYDTKGKNGALSSHTITGTAEADENGDWKKEFFYDTVSEALTKLSALCG